MYERKRQKYLTEDEIKDQMENMNDEIFTDSDADEDENDNDISLLNNEEDGIDILVFNEEEDKNEASTCVDESKKLKSFYWSSPSENETVKKDHFYQQHRKSEG